MMLDRWRARRAEKAASARTRQHRPDVIAQVRAAVEAADPARVRPAAAAALADALAGSPGRALTDSLNGAALDALAALQAALAATSPMSAETAEELYIVVDSGWDESSEPSEVLEAIENWAGYLKEPSVGAAASVLWLCVLASDDEAVALESALRNLRP